MIGTVMNMRIMIISFFTMFVCGSTMVSASSGADYWPTQGWRTTTPEEQGMDSKMLANMLQTIRDQAMNVDSITIVRNS